MGVTNFGAILTSQMGVVTLDGSGATTVEISELTTITGAVATIKKADSPGVSTIALTVDWTGNTLSIYPWKVTAVDDATLVASDGEEVVCYFAWGT